MATAQLADQRHSTSLCPLSGQQRCLVNHRPHISGPSSIQHCHRESLSLPSNIVVICTVSPLYDDDQLIADFAYALIV
ncbi:hypothetical protein Q1695_002049 [Nippostrongylus brasiliensis]|nr:hypothetical protein Q1695_002049 [Nippostrongylus brasiliensis]